MKRIFIIGAYADRKAAKALSRIFRNLGEVSVFSEKDRIDPVSIASGAEKPDCAVIIWSKRAAKIDALKSLNRFALLAGDVVSISLDGAALPIELEWSNIENPEVRASPFGGAIDKTFFKRNVKSPRTAISERAYVSFIRIIMAVAFLGALALALYLWLTSGPAHSEITLGALWPMVARFQRTSRTRDEEDEIQPRTSWKHRSLKVFLSSNNADEDRYVRNCFDIIEHNNCEVFHHTNRKDFYLVREKVKNEIERSDVFLLVLSMNAIGSTWVRREVAIAESFHELRLRKAIVEEKRRSRDARPLRPHEAEMAKTPRPNLKKTVIFQIEEVSFKLAERYPQILTIEEVWKECNPLMLHKIPSPEEQEEEIRKTLARLREDFEEAYADE